MTHVLIVEDNKDLAFGLQSNLELEGYEVTIASTGTEGLQAARVCDADLIVLDVMLPGMDGYEVLRNLREFDHETSVLMLTARGEEFDKVRGLRTGADDYVTKPFGLMELLARIEALLRRRVARSTNGGAGSLALRDLLIDPRTRCVTRSGETIDLAPKEFDLLVELVRRRGAIATRSELMRAVWGHSAAVVSRTVDTHIAELRRKLADTDQDVPLIVTVRKAGYRIEPD